MSINALITFFIGILVGVTAVLVPSVMYIENLHHVACKMYDSVEDQYRFDYVNKQFRCNNLSDRG